MQPCQAFITLLIALTLTTLQANAADGSQAYNLFHPMPREELHPFDTDRPSRGVSPFTVDPGWQLLEADVVNYAKSPPPSHEQYNFARATLRTGLVPGVESQIAIPFYNSQTGDGPKHGFGDVELRCKLNFLRQGNNQLGIGILPGVTIPTGARGFTSKAVEGSLPFMIAYALNDDWTLGLTLEWDWRKNEEDMGTHTEFGSGVVVTRAIGERFATFIEVYSLGANVSNAGGIAATVDTGLTFKATENVQLDVGLNIGVTEAADDLNAFTGIATRF